MTDVWADAHRPRGRRLIFDVTWTLVFAVVSILGGISLSRASLISSLVVIIAVAIRRVWLRASVAIAIVGGILQLAVPQGFAPVASLGYAAITFVLGGHRDRRVRVFGLGLSIAASIACGLWGGLAGPGDGVARSHFFELDMFAWFLVMGAFTSLGGWVAGLLQYQTRSGVQAKVDAQLLEAEQLRLAQAYEQEQERSAIAADMHDVVAHAWAVVAAQADGARYLLRTSPDEAERALEVIGDTARSTIADLRGILQQLKYQEATGALPGYSQHATLFDRMRASGMDLTVTAEGEPDESDALLAMTSYRLVSESLTNALKHGDLDKPVVLTQDWRNGYHLYVRNTMRPGALAEGTGNGVSGMIQRAAVSGGKLSAGRSGNEWVVDASLPAPERESEKESDDDPRRDG